MADYRALAQALDPYAMDTGGITPDTLKALQTINKSPNLLGMISDIGRGGLSNLESLVRGGVAQVPGTAGDLETLGRMGINTSFGAGGVKVSPKAVLPTTTDILGMLPQRVTQARPETEGMEQLGGAMNPRGPINLGRAVMRLPSDVARAGKEFLMANQPSRLDVYHGTPHSFERFDASKIGTGEGAQAYGHGIYVAENPEVAKRYQYQLAPERNARDLNTKVGYIKIGDKPINPDNYDIDIQQELVDAAKLGKKEFLDFANKRKTRWEELSKDESYPYRGTANERVNEYNKLISDAKELGVTYTGSGTLYKADLPDEMIPTMLDWDKHLSEQSHEVQKILYPYQKEIGSSFGTGEQTLRQIAFERRMKGLDDSPSAVAQQLKDMGITGVKYLDEASRGTKYRGDSAFLHAATDFKNNDYSLNDALEGMKKAYKNASEQELRDALDAVYTPKTSNFVVFPGQEQNLTILERNAEKITK